MKEAANRSLTTSAFRKASAILEQGNSTQLFPSLLAHVLVVFASATASTTVYKY